MKSGMIVKQGVMWLEHRRLKPSRPSVQEPRSVQKGAVKEDGGKAVRRGQSHRKCEMIWNLGRMSRYNPDSGAIISCNSLLNTKTTAFR